jgi:hypothetical protein
MSGPTAKQAPHSDRDVAKSRKGKSPPTGFSNSLTEEWELSIFSTTRFGSPSRLFTTGILMAVGLCLS